MYQFNSIQSALDYVFDGKKLTIVNLPDSPYPWFLVDEIRNILEYNVDNYEFTKKLEFRDQVIAVLNLSNFRQIGTHHASYMVCSYLSSLSSNRNYITLIAEPGLYELLIRSHMPKAKPFREWLFFTVLPTLRANPQLVEQINDLTKQRDRLKSEIKRYSDECYTNRKKVSNLKRCVKNAKILCQNLQASYERLRDLNRDPNDFNSFDYAD